MRGMHLHVEKTVRFFLVNNNNEDNDNNNNTHLTTFVRDYLGEPVPERIRPVWIYWCKRQWVAVASSGPYANLHLAPDRWPRQHLIPHFF